MGKISQRRFPGRVREHGFALAISLLLVSLLMVLALGLLGMASIELRNSSRGELTAQARANARLALVKAIGQLQRTMGPDQRVSASAEILRKPVSQPHWTGVWRSVWENGDPFMTRDDLAGGLRDERWEKRLNPADLVVEWLVSGGSDPTATPGADAVDLLKIDSATVVRVPKVGVAGKSGIVAGHHAWWTGDLGVRANLQTGDARAELAASRSDPASGGLFRVMVSQAADMKLMTNGVNLENSARERLASAGMLSFAGVDRDWGRKHVLDFTTDSLGVLANVADGGLKQDLTAYFENGAVSPSGNLAGLADDDSLVGELAAPDSRHRLGGPRFGLLRDWARLAIPFSGKDVAATLPDFDTSAGGGSALRALANEKPVKLAGNQQAGLQPVLVEAANFTQFSAYVHQTSPYPLYQLRQLMYPRVVLWNPYNCELKFDRSMIMIQGNGRQEMWTRNRSGGGSYIWDTQWLCFEGGRSTGFTGQGDIQSSAPYNDPYMGSYYFAIPATTFAPGECLVFSPPRCAEYDGLSDYRPGSYNLNANVLSCEVSPDPARSYYVSASDIGGGFSFLPLEFWYAKTPYWSKGGRDGVENQVDDTRAILKHVGDAGTIHFEDFDKLPQVAVLSASFQYGAGCEPRLVWGGNERMPMQLLDKSSPQPTLIPNVRTREGIRLRWFDEHPSNQIGSGPLAGSAHFEEALLANWNPRASFILRSPWENIAGEGGPWFFGAYTRDLFDQAVSWEEQMPVPRDGRYHGNPFGPPQEGNGRYVLFDVPRSETGLVSLGQLQHAKLSELVWHPSYAVGNSLADPRLGAGGFHGLNRTAAVASETEAADLGGFGESEIGWSDDTQQSSGKDDWAATARAILGELPDHDNLVYDLSFEVNRTLWDRFYLSSGTPAEKRSFLEDTAANPLPNGRIRLAPGPRAAATAERLADFHHSASHLMVDGAFNVNSTRVEAWKALLGSTRLSGFGSDGNVPFPRVLDPQDGAWKNGDSPDSDKVWAGYRELTEGEIGRLAVAIVAEVKLRGPFLSLADFVNRRLAEDETGRMGALQAAIEKAGLNSGLTAAFPLNNQDSLPDYNHPNHLPDATRIEQTLKPSSKAWGAPSYLTQADVLQVLGPALSARSDTFVIRAYGDAVDGAGNVRARAWCEAMVQRTPEPLDPDDSGINSRLTGQAGDFGRRFILTSFRWLVPEEI